MFALTSVLSVKIDRYFISKTLILWSCAQTTRKKKNKLNFLSTISNRNLFVLQNSWPDYDKEKVIT